LIFRLIFDKLLTIIFNIKYMKDILTIIQVIVSILLAITILVQQKGTGLSSTFGGSGGGNFYSSKRGVEKLLARFTVVLAILFVGNAALYMFLPYITTS